MRKNLVYYWAFLQAALSLPSAGADLPGTFVPPVRARVVIAENPRATVAFAPQPDIVQGMVDNGILKLTGKSDLKQAWLTFVTTKDVVGIKVFSEPGANSGTRPAVVGAIIEGLLQAGLEPSHIIIWDKRLLDLRLSGFDDLAREYQVSLAGASDSGYDPAVYYDNSIMGSLVAGDYDFDHGAKTTGRYSYVTKLLTKKVTKIINVCPLLNHNFAGVCGNLYSLAMGSVDNTLRFEASPERLATAVPEIYAKPELSDHVVLNITDALVGQYQGELTSLLHYSTALNQIWFSTDAVALDIMGIQELNRERQERNIRAANETLGLYHNAAFFLELGVDDPAKIRVYLAK